MTRRTVAVAMTTALGLAVLGGCSQTRTTTGSVNDAKTLTGQDWYDFAAQLVASLEERQISQRYTNNGRPPVVVIGDFKNNTSKAGFTRQKDFMYNALQTELVNSGRYTVNMDIAGEGGDVETMIRDARLLRGSDEYDQSTVAQRGTMLAPDLILYGEIGRIIAEEGRTKQYDYQVNTRMIDVRTGQAVWFGTIPLSKTFTRGVLG